MNLRFQGSLTLAALICLTAAFFGSGPTALIAFPAVPLIATPAVPLIAFPAVPLIANQTVFNKKEKT